MKIALRMALRIAFAGLCLFVLSSSLSHAQEKSKKYQTYMIHEDVVKPSMVLQYEKATKGFVDALKENKSTGNFYCANTNDFTYYYLTPIDKMADLDENQFADVFEKLGEEKVKTIFDEYDGCYDVHRNYMASLSYSLSYIPEGGELFKEGEEFREWTFLHIDPAKDSEARELMMEWKKLYADAKAPYGYAVYVGGIGLEVPVYVIVGGAKDSKHMDQIQSENVMAVGLEKVKEMRMKTLPVMRKMENKQGMARPDLSYWPAD